MDLVDSLEEIFQWQNPFCTFLNDCNIIDNVIDPEVIIPSIDDMLVDIELPEMNITPELYAASHSKPVSHPLDWPSNSTCTNSANSNFQIQTSVSNLNPLTAINTEVSSDSQIEITRGFESIAAPSTSPLSSAPNTPPPVGKPKRSRGSGKAGGPAKSKSSSPKTKKGTAEKSKENRVPTKAEHIIRERQRRDDMAAKYTILESLLPPVPKRERAVVVEDAISFVGTLQQKKEQLLQRRADLKAMAPRVKKITRSLAPRREPASGTVHNLKQRSAVLENCLKFDSPLSASSDGADLLAVDNVNIVTSESRAVQGPSTTYSAISAINVHTGEEEIVMEMVWSQPRSNFQSVLLQAVESMGFDVTKCSILRVGNGYIHCVITCTMSQVLTSQISSEIQSSSTMIIRALRNVLIQS